MQLVSNGSTFVRPDYQVDFSLKSLVTGLGSQLQASHHLQLKEHIFLRLVLICAAQALRNELETSLLHASQLLKSLYSDSFDFDKVEHMPLQVLQHLKAEDSFPILYLAQQKYCLANAAHLLDLAN